MRCVLSIIVVFLAITAGTATAQPSMAPDNSAFQPPPPPPPPPRVKSGRIATLLAIAVPSSALMVSAAAMHEPEPHVVLGVAGGLLVIGPSAGHAYAGELDRAVRGSLVRIGAAAVLSGGIALNSTSSCVGCQDTVVGNALITVGAFSLLGATIYEIYDAHRAAGRTNARHARRAHELQLGASVITTRNGTAPALTLGGRF